MRLVQLVQVGTGPTGATGRTGPTGTTGTTGPQGNFGGDTMLSQYFGYSTSIPAYTCPAYSFVLSGAGYPNSQYLEISEYSFQQTNILAWISSWNASTNPTVKGSVRISLETDSDYFIDLQIFSLATTYTATSGPGNIYVFSVSNVADANVLNAGDVCTVSWARAGDQGAAGSAGPQGPAGQFGGDSLSYVLYLGDSADGSYSAYDPNVSSGYWGS